jgi:mRNA capping enzyme.
MSLNFCIHYFFQDEISLRTIIQNANDVLKNDGYLFGTCFDGERIHEQLKNKNEILGKTFDGSIMWKIEKNIKGK